MTAVCVTGATGFVGGHVARLLAERGDEVRVTYRDRARLDRLGGIEAEPVKADVLDRAAMRRAVRGCELVFHTAGVVGSRPAERVWEVNAVGPRIAVEAAAAEDVRRIVVTSSVAGIGPVAPGEVGDEDRPFTGGGGMTYVEAKHEGELEAFAAGARAGIEVVVVNPSYVLGAPVDRSQRGETSTRTVGNYLRGRLPAAVDGQMNIVDVRDVATGHLLAAGEGRPGERYILGGHNLTWPEFFERVADLSGVHHPVAILPRESAEISRVAERLGVPGLVSAEGLVLMAQNWRYSSRKAKRELGYRPRSLNATLRETIEWYQELIEAGAFNGDRPSSLSVAAAGMRLAARVGLVRGAHAAERYLGRRLVSGA
jgi:dihydroflavonol-4-reductase